VAKIIVTVKVEIEQANGDYTKLERKTEDEITDNPLYFAAGVEAAEEKVRTFVLNAVEDRFGSRP